MSRAKKAEEAVEEVLTAVEEEAYVYMLRCGDGSLYTGWTNDPAHRLRTHQKGQGGKYTRSRLPVEMVYLKKCPTRPEAMRLEYRIKRLTREEKCALVAEGGGWPLPSSDPKEI